MGFCIAESFSYALSSKCFGLVLNSYGVSLFPSSYGVIIEMENECDMSMN